MMRIMSKHCLDNFAVMPGLVPGIHVSLAAEAKADLDGRDKPGHDAADRFTP